MTPFKLTISFFLSLYCVGLVSIFYYQNIVMSKRGQQELESFYLTESSTHSDFFLNSTEDNYDLISSRKVKFTSPTLSYKILNQLDVYKPVSEFQIIELQHEPKFDSIFYGFKNDDEYCTKHRADFVENPEIVFEGNNIVLARLNYSFITNRVIPNFAHLLHPNNNARLPQFQQENPTFDIDPSVNIFHTTKPMFLQLHLGKQFSCLSQASNYLLGNTKLARKDLVAEAASEYVSKYQDRPQCLNYDKFFPKTYVLSREDDCNKFFKLVNSKEYKELQKEKRIVFMKKIAGMHKGEGVQPFNKEQEVSLKRGYKNGSLCGKIKARILMQHYIHNPLLIYGHKFDFRMYMLVASVNPLIVYYHDGFLRVSLASYDINSDDKRVLLTNLALNKEIYHESDLKSKEELQHAQQWTFERFQKYLLEMGIITDPNWLDNHLRPEFQKALIHLTRFGLNNVIENSSMYELFGVDFMLDTNLNLWFIEANSGPAFTGYSNEVDPIIVKMLKDHFELVLGLLRSRMKRVVEYVNQLVKDGEVMEMQDGSVVIKEINQKLKTFEKISKNYFEKEFEIRESNGFVKIVDANEEGIYMYQGLIKEECL